ncbi:MAG: VCBS repeat-containing protein [Deltaproteobacteria bacterium]|nr:VCBS repeat-containing protein [Deltaproteobacteria bacterium]
MIRSPALAWFVFLPLLACDSTEEPDDTSGPEDTSETAAGEPQPGEAFDRWCLGRDWQDTLVPGVVGAVSGAFPSSLSEEYRLEGVVETDKVVPPHPFHVTRIQMAFAAGPGRARIRIMGAWGRSYPGEWPDLDAGEWNLIEPIEIDIPEDAGAAVWQEVDVSSLGLFLEPTQHYMIVHEYPSDGDPGVYFVSAPSDESDRGLLLIPGEDMPWGIGGNFKMQLTGEFFCQWDDDERWFEDVTATQPFAEDSSGMVGVVDLDGDGHQDVWNYDAGPTIYLGDGQGHFEVPAVDPLAEARTASFLIFGDIDNDGDPDAFAAVYTGADSDGDRSTLAEGDCNDADDSIEPGEDEVVDYRDNDCDGIADDGTDTSDHDLDGSSIADGDCDDTLTSVHPKAPELHDGIDNDCDGETDEDWTSFVLTNDGTGLLHRVEASGIQAVEPSTAGGFGDGDLDGRLDLYFGNWLEQYPNDPAVQDRYYEGLGDGTFRYASEEAGLLLPEAFSVYGVNWNDYNDDGCPDIFVGNYHLYDNQLWENQCDGTFVDVALEVGVAHDDEPSPYANLPGGHTYGGEWGDFDNDGDWDSFICNLSHPRTQPWADPSMFVVNQGPPDYTFTNEREARGFIYDEGDVNAQWGDFDNDMDIDLAVASLYSGHRARIYRNDGGRFTDVTYEMGVDVEDAIAVVWVDVDEDGDEDLFVGDRFLSPYLHLFVNRVGQDAHWVDLVVEGTDTNRDGAGAKVVLEAGGVTQMRIAQDGNGHWNTQKPRTLHFGLGSHTTVDAVSVRWVAGGTETFTGVGVDGRFRLVEGTGVAVPESR